MRNPAFPKLSFPSWTKQLVAERDLGVISRAWRLRSHGTWSRNVRSSFYPIIAEAELSIGNHDAVRTIATKMLRKDDPIGHYYLSLSNFLLANHSAAIEHLEALLDQRPYHPDGTYLLAEVFRSDGSIEQAWQALERLAPHSKRAKTWLLMANLVQTRQDYQRLSANCERWLTQHPHTPFRAHVTQYLALGALRSGYKETARSILAKGLLEAASIRSTPNGHSARIKNAYSPRLAERALADVNRTLDAAGIRMFLVSGTLLGYIREGRLLPNDNDVDVGIWSDVDRELLTQAIRTSGLFYILPSRTHHTLRLRHVTGVGVDVFFHVREPNDFWHGGVLMTWHNSPFRLREQSFRGTTYWIPADHDKYLSENYGNWRIPQTPFDSAYDTPNGECIDTKELVCYTYKRLFEAFTAGKTDRAVCYLNKLQELGETSFAEHFSSKTGVAQRSI